MTRAAMGVCTAALVACLFLLVPEAWERLAAVSALAYLPAAALVVLACAGAGLALMRVLHIDAGEDAAWIAVPLGAGVVGHVQLALAHLHVFGRASSLVIVAAGVLLLFAQRRVLRESAWPVPPTRAGTAWIAACAPFLVAAVFACAVPPAFYDALVYHVGLVEQLVVRGGAVVTSHDMFTAMPLASELATGTAFAISGAPEAMSLVHALFFAVLVVGVASTARAAFGADTAGPAAFVVASMPLPLFLAAADKPDILAALLFLVALRCALRCATTGRIDAKLVLVALGLAAATKTSALPIGAAFFATLLLVPSTRRALLGGSAQRRALLVGLVVGAALAAPPYLRNAIALGNPFFPFASSVFGGPAWLAHTTALLEADAQRARSLADVGALLGRVFLSSDPFANEVVGPLALLALLAPLVIPRADAPAAHGVSGWRAVMLLVVVTAVTLVPWLATHALPRYDPVLWLALALAAGLVIGRLAATRFVVLLVPLVVALALVNASWSLRANEALLRGPMQTLAGADERDVAIARALDLLPAYRAALDASLRAPKGCVFLATGDARIAYLGAPAVLSEVYTQPTIVAVLEGARGVEDVVARIRATGATHVLIDDRAPALLARRGWAVDAPLLAEVVRALPVAWRGERAVILEVPGPVDGPCSLP